MILIERLVLERGLKFPPFDLLLPFVNKDNVSIFQVPPFDLGLPFALQWLG